MTVATDQFIDLAKRSQEAVTTAVRTWADTVQTYAGTMTGTQAKLPDAHAFVDSTFDFAEKVLANQRQLAHTLFSAGTQTVEAVTDQAARAAESVSAQMATEKAAAKPAPAAEAPVAKAGAARAAQAKS
ncbi:hypothetical protein [Pseudonocardia asaccharolytica]|uniref:Phasin domain-containing protein n=1 Tax=Pseudonocardia asaccharolytica DSM 44247 = NBRC 16224 TaxID=1123024 RepID=A0A511D4A5_9PSEU|nr:hypothetical protein [Pseudonocardia asaccharolytica]GEL19630.1 hypothetical protein PA7_34670 [Pseudonocardia asaccharolytica DSM 44247 = NBRC 16224]